MDCSSFMAMHCAVTFQTTLTAKSIPSKSSAHKPWMLHFLLWLDVKIWGSMKHICLYMFILHLFKVLNITPEQSLCSRLFVRLLNLKWILNGGMVYTKLYRISDSVFFVMESRNSCWLMILTNFCLYDLLILMLSI